MQTFFVRVPLKRISPTSIHKAEMSATDWQLSLKLVDQPKSTFTFPEMMPGDVPPGGYRVATLKQLVAAQLPDSIPDPDLIGPLHLWRSCRSMYYSRQRCKPSLNLFACFVLVSELVHCGRKLKDDLTLDACGIQSGATIHILKRTWPEPESSPGLLGSSTAIANISAV